MDEWQHEETRNLHMNSYSLRRFVLDWARASKKKNAHFNLLLENKEFLPLKFSRCGGFFHCCSCLLSIEQVLTFANGFV